MCQFLPFRTEGTFFSALINYGSLKGHCDTVTFEIVMSNPRKRVVGEPLGTTSVVEVGMFSAAADTT